MNPREELKRRIVRERIFCEGQGYVAHECRSGMHMHEVFYKRNDAKTKSQRAYIVNKRNCAIVCGWFHEHYGNARKFTEWFAGVQQERYLDLDEYLSYAPFKVRVSLDSFL